MDPQQVQLLLDTVSQQQDQIKVLVQTFQNLPGVQNPMQVNVNHPVPDVNVIRAENVQKISLNLRKSSRVKIFKADTDIDAYLRKFREEIKTLKQMFGIANDLSRDEYVSIFRASLDYHVIERVEQVFVKDPLNPKTWANISIEDLHKLMKDEFGSKATDVAEVLKQFGTSRKCKSSEQNVQEFYFDWLQSIPEVMRPTDQAGRIAFVDLIHRSMFYISLNDKYLQQALSDLKLENPKLNDFVTEAVAVESRRRCFQDIANCSSSLDKGGGLNL